MTFHYPVWIEIILSVLVIVGSVFITIGTLALYRLPDFYTRLHGPPQATTLGMGSLVAASILSFSLTEGALNLSAIAITLFLVLSGPINGYILAKAAVLQQLAVYRKTRGKPMEQ